MASPDPDRSQLLVQPDTNAAIALALLSSRIGTRGPSVYRCFFKHIKNAEWVVHDLGGKRTGIVTRWAIRKNLTCQFRDNFNNLPCLSQLLILSWLDYPPVNWNQAATNFQIIIK
jgi:hypothetical protein